MTIFDCLEAKPLELFDGADITDKENFAYWQGDIPMLIQAHVDTVLSKPPRITSTDYIIRGSNGLGADDRAGVFICQQLRKEFPNLPILLTNHEETGGKGMDMACYNLIEDIEHIRLAIAVDRKGCGEYVTYNDLPAKAEKYVKKFGWEENMGTFSDVSIFTDEFRIPSVNVSAGFHKEHTAKEYLVIDEMYLTIHRIRQMILNPIKRLYKTKEYASSAYGGNFKYSSYYRGYTDADIPNDAIPRTSHCPFCYGESLDFWEDECYCGDCGEIWNVFEHSAFDVEQTTFDMFPEEKEALERLRMQCAKY